MMMPSICLQVFITFDLIRKHHENRPMYNVYLSQIYKKDWWSVRTERIKYLYVTRSCNLYIKQ